MMSLWDLLFTPVKDDDPPEETPKPYSEDDWEVFDNCSDREYDDDEDYGDDDEESEND